MFNRLETYRGIEERKNIGKLVLLDFDSSVDVGYGLFYAIDRLLIVTDNHW